MFKKLIEVCVYAIKIDKINTKFDHEKYQKLAEKTKKVQEIRNSIAHKYLLPNKDGLSTYPKLKSFKTLMTEMGEMKGSFSTEKLDLDKALDESIKLCDEWESISGEIMVKFAVIFNNEIIKES